MKIENDKVAIIHYTLKNEGGEVLDTSEGQAPMGYLHGKKNIIPGLETALEGKATGDKINVTIEPNDAYGARSDEMIKDVPLDQFQNLEEIKPGMNLQVSGPQGTQIVTVVEVTDAAVKVDFNHPLAGVTLFFDVEVIEVREATEDEISHGHVHGPEGHEH